MSPLSIAAAERPGLLDRLISVPSRRPRHSVSCSSFSRGAAGCPASEHSLNRMVAIGWLCLRGGYGLRVPGEVSFFTVALL